VIVINLLPQEERVEERAFTAPPRAKILVPIIAAIVLVVPPVGTYVLQASKVQALRRDVALVDQEAQNLKPRLELMRQINAQRESLQQRLDVIRGLNRDRTQPVRLMDQLAAQVPPNLWLTRFKQTSAGTVELEGITFSNIVVADLMSQLEATNLYENVGLTVTSREPLGEAQVTKFTLTAGIQTDR
jgi:type IV pilus assembly protein PilN